MAFKEDFAHQFNRLKRKYELTSLEAVSQAMGELGFIVETAPDREYEKEEMEILKEQKAEKTREVKAKWRERNRQALAEYAKDYRIKYCGQRKEF